jgi:hypothetical protein
MKAGKRPCYISRHGIAHIRLTDKRYKSEYKPLVKSWRNAARDHPLTDKRLDQLLVKAIRLLIDMGWPDRSLSAVDKFFIDIQEVFVDEKAQQYKQKGIMTNHDTIAKKHFKKDLKRALRLTEEQRKSEYNRVLLQAGI